jgi:hypothetical protein
VALRPLREREPQKGFAGVGNTRIAGVAAREGVAVGGNGAVECCRVVEIERCTVPFGERRQGLTGNRQLRSGFCCLDGDRVRKEGQSFSI